MNDYNGDTLAFFHSIQPNDTALIEEENAAATAQVAFQKLGSWE